MLLVLALLQLRRRVEQVDVARQHLHRSIPRSGSVPLTHAAGGGGVLGARLSDGLQSP